MNVIDKTKIALSDEQRRTFTYRVYRDHDVRYLRKVVIQLHHASMDPLPIDRARIFAGPRLKQRLAKRMKKMAERGYLMVLASEMVAAFNDNVPS